MYVCISIPLFRGPDPYIIGPSKILSFHTRIKYSHFILNFFPYLKYFLIVPFIGELTLLYFLGLYTYSDHTYSKVIGLKFIFLFIDIQHNYLVAFRSKLPVPKIYRCFTYVLPISNPPFPTISY